MGAPRGEAARFTGSFDERATNRGVPFIPIFKAFVMASYKKP